MQSSTCRPRVEPRADIMDPPQELFPLPEPASPHEVSRGESGQEGADKEEWQQQPQQPPIYMAIVPRRARATSQSSTPSTPSSPEGLHQRMSDSVRQANFRALPDSGQYRAQAVELLEQVAFERRRTLGDGASPTNGDVDAAVMLFASKGAHTDAEAALRATLDGRRRTHGEESAATIRSMLSLAKVIHAQPDRVPRAHAQPPSAAAPPLLYAVLCTLPNFPRPHGTVSCQRACQPARMAPHPALVPRPLNLHPHPT
jgi:hypothetical protein